MKVLQINAYNYLRGGSESVFLNTIRMLEEHGHEVIRFTLKWPENIPSRFSEYFPESKETRHGISRVPRNIINYFNHREAARNLERLITKEKPDIAHIHLIWGQLSGAILPVLKRHGIPVIHTAHDFRIVCPAYLFRNGKGEICEKCHDGSFLHCITGRCHRGNVALSAMMAAEQYYRNALFNPSKYFDGLIFVSEFARQIHYRHMPLLRNVSSDKIFNFSKSIVSAPPDKSASEKYYLYFGRLSHEKGVSTLIKTFAGLPDLKLKIAGTGPSEEELKLYVNDNNLTNVSFLGFKSGKELTDLVSGAHFVIVPSEWYENNPMTVIEAYSMGVPVIGARIGGIPEIVIDNSDLRSGSDLIPTGYIFESGDTNSLHDAIVKAESLTPDEYSILSEGALQFARSNFDPEVYYHRLMDFYNRILKSRQ